MRYCKATPSGVLVKVWNVMHMLAERVGDFLYRVGEAAEGLPYLLDFLGEKLTLNLKMAGILAVLLIPPVYVSLGLIAAGVVNGFITALLLYNTGTVEKASGAAGIVPFVVAGFFLAHWYYVFEMVALVAYAIFSMLFIPIGEYAAEIGAWEETFPTGP
ncbi:hypothetical protein [Thermococcus sp. Bubb.Bath]|uniref:hypothetical protein n=1 Tax=Thermococcus sp. Bubb.Bath TaxID=1638242 RepID=UPI00143B32BE|nr:hypothetical protein [Thermococcus sp. Bubb.Bath]NJF24403.1 hypothetical protein [Thermococcus sp. Bubb.Bath]